MSRAPSKSKVELMLDSGAFTAWTKRVEIDIDSYIDFAKEHQGQLSHIANLDVIPGVFGQKVLTKDDIEGSAEKGWDNYQYMLKKKVSKDKLMHIFHQGEDFKWLQKLKDFGPKFIGISPANDKITPVRAEWLKRCMKILCDSKGKPLVKFHGYAATSFRLMNNFPWESVDSGSWRQSTAYGGIYVPGAIKSKKFVWKSTPLVINISSRKKIEDSRKTLSFFDIPQEEGKNKRLFDARPFEWKKMIEQIITDYGFDFEEMRKSYKERAAWNIFYFLQLQKEVKNNIAFATVCRHTLPFVEKAILRANPKKVLFLFSYYYVLKKGTQKDAWDHYLQLLKKEK